MSGQVTYGSGLYGADLYTSTPIWTPIESDALYGESVYGAGLYGGLDAPWNSLGIVNINYNWNTASAFNWNTAPGNWRIGIFTDPYTKVSTPTNSWATM